MPSATKNKDADKDAQPESRQILMGSAFVMASRIISMASMIVFSVFMARSLGRDIYGLISIAIGVFGITTIISDMGLNVASTRYTALYNKKGMAGRIKDILIASIATKMLSGFVLMTTLLIFAPSFNTLFNKPVAPLITIMALAILFNMPASAFQSVIRGHGRMGLFAFTNMVRDVTWVTTSTALVLSGGGVIGAVTGYLAGQVMWLIANAGAYFAYIQPSAPRTGGLKESALTLLKFGLPVITMDLMIFLYNWADTFVIGIFRATWEVSCYNIAFGMINMAMIVIASVSTAVFPLFSAKSVDKDPKVLSENYYRLTKIIALAVFPMITGMVLLEPYLILVYGSEYLPALIPLWILAIWGYFRPYGNMSNTMLTALGRQHYVLYTTTFTALLNVALNLVLVPPIGMVGAAIASTVSITLGTLLSVWYLHRLEAIKIRFLWALKMGVSAVAVGLPYLALTNILDRYINFTQSLTPLVVTMAIVLVAYMGTFIWISRRLNIVDNDDALHIKRATEHLPGIRTIVQYML